MVRFVSDDTDLHHHETFLRKLARRPTRLDRLRLFTTNYDLAFETAAARTGHLLIDGFSFGQPRSYNPLYFDYDFVRRDAERDTLEPVPNVSYFYKLHGSVNWDGSDARILQSASPARPVLIFPRQSKYELSYERPFLESMSRFQTSLRLPNLGLLVVGFGMNDKHIVEPILAAVRSNPAMRVLLISRNLSASDRPAVQRLTSLVREGDSRICLLSATFEQFVPLIPDLVPRTDEERHAQRLTQLLDP